MISFKITHIDLKKTHHANGPPTLQNLIAFTSHTCWNAEIAEDRDGRKVGRKEGMTDLRMAVV